MRLRTEFKCRLTLRRRGAMTRTGQIITWIIEKDGIDTAVRKELTEEERQLPIVGLWNHEFLIIRICQGWSPEQEGCARAQEETAKDEIVLPTKNDTPLQDKDAINALSSVSNTQIEHRFDHYLYFPLKQHGKK